MIILILPIITLFLLQRTEACRPRLECPVYILSIYRRVTKLTMNISYRIQPLNPKNLESSFSPNYSRFPIPIGIGDRLFRDPTISSN